MKRATGTVVNAAVIKRGFKPDGPANIFPLKWK
jgi:hypothetical protein